MAERRESRTIHSGKQRLPLLRNATVEEVETSIEYKTGASYKGQLLDNKKAGRGVFTWPNGAKYEGEFIDNSRQGKGQQTFGDGTVYEGDFDDDMRHGQGSITWPNRESYVGHFFNDRRHGYGTYHWPDGSQYTGMFYMDRKEGYGAFTFADGSKFEGLYKSDDRFGPGVQTYADSTQDVGLWHRERLVKLCGHLKEAFTIHDTEFEYDPENNKMYIHPEYLQNRTDVIENILNPPEQFDYPPQIDVSEKTIEQIFHDTLDARSLAVDIRAFDEAFFEAAIKSRLARHSAKSPSKSISVPGSAKSLKSTSSKIPSVKGGKKGETEQKRTPSNSRQASAKSQRSTSAKSLATIAAVEEDDEGIFEEEEVAVEAWNKTPSCVAMQKHVIRHSPSQKNITFDVEQVVAGDRAGFGDPGPIETLSLEFLTAALEGDCNKVSDFLIEDKVHVDVADKSGHTALLGAAVHCHEEVINCLLDNGADVNKLNNEGVSALAACHVNFYSSERFKYNIAEKEGEPPLDMDKESGYDVNEAVKGFLSNKKAAVSSEKKPTHEEKLEDEKISRLRQQYGHVNNSAVDLNQSYSTDYSSVSKQSSEKQLGTLKFKRAVRINVDDVMAVDDNPPTSDRDLGQWTNRSGLESNFSDDSDPGPEEFASETSVRNYPISISNQLIERCATTLSTNDMVVNRARSAKSDPSSLGTVRRLAIDKREHVLMENTIRLLLRRGADPNAANVPMPVLFFAVKVGDVEAVRLLLMKGASTKARLPENKGGLTPLHIAVALPGEEGVQITELLLNALADPDARAVPDTSFLNRNLEEEWSKDAISEESERISGGRTPLHIACARDDSYKNACKAVHLLLDHHANPNLLCNGNSPLSLAIISGNDMAIDELLAYNADPCLPLTHGVGSGLCVASSTEYEHRRNPDNRLKLIDKLVRAGGDILAPILIGPKRLQGTAVDYSYYMYNLDRRIAHMPYHALSLAERETYNARRRLLAHMGDILRVKAVEKEKVRLIEEQLEGRRSRSPSPNFVYMGAGQRLPNGMVKSAKIPGRAALLSDSKVSFSGGKATEGDIRKLPVDRNYTLHRGISQSKRRSTKNCLTRKPLLRYCYECGRSVGVRLSACTRCKEVYYCSKVCKVKAWNARHKEECIRIGGQSMSPGKDRVDSPTPQTDPDKGRPTHVQGIMGPNQRIKQSLPGAGSGENVSLNNLGPAASDRHGHKGDLDRQMVGGKKYPTGNNPTNGALPRGKKLEYIGSIKVNDLKGKGQGYLKGASALAKGGKAPLKNGGRAGGKKNGKAGMCIDPVTGLIKVIDPHTGKISFMDNYSFV